MEGRAMPRLGWKPLSLVILALILLVVFFAPELASG
jgi:hypothetical protein